MSVAELGITATRIARELDEWPRRRADLGELTGLLLAAEPALHHAPERRARLGEVIDQLAAAGIFALPAERSYDRSAQPALPRFVTLRRSRPARRRHTGAGIAWRSQLAWAGDLSFDEQTLRDLRAINAFLRDGGAERPVVPLRERSVQLFGDEKRLERLLGGQLFSSERLTLQQLRCEQIHPPFVYQQVGAGPDALVFENHHTYVSFARTMPADGAVGWLVYAAGSHFKASVTYLADMPAPVRRVLYFGDLDVAGLEIPVRANEVALATALPQVEAAGGLYRLLLDHGRPQLVKGGPSHRRVHQLTAWLPSDLQAQVTMLLTQGERLAQEWVGTEALLRHREMLRTL